MEPLQPGSYTAHTTPAKRTFAVRKSTSLTRNKFPRLGGSTTWPTEMNGYNTITQFQKLKITIRANRQVINQTCICNRFSPVQIKQMERKIGTCLS